MSQRTLSPRLWLRSVTLAKVARWIGIVSCVWFGLAAAWGLFGLLPGGHVGAGHSGLAMASEQILRWKTIYPSWGWYEPTYSPANAYCHHPFGAFWVSALSLAVFGHRDFAVPLPSVLMSAMTAPLLYLIGRKNWGVVGGLAAACSFVVVPIALGFANFHNLEVMCIFGWLLFFYGHSRLLSSWNTRDLIISLVGATIAVSAEWEGYIAVGIVLGWSLFRAYLLPPRFSPSLRILPYSRWWALTTTICVVTLVMWVGLFIHVDKLNEWLGSATGRGGAESSSLASVLEGRKHWIDISFTPLAIWLGKLAAPVCLLRLVVLRRDSEVYALAVLIASLVHYLGFKQAADVHIFWPHYFACYYALAMAQLWATLRDGLAALLGALRIAGADTWAASVALGFPVLVSIVMFPDAVRTLRFSRETGGRYGDIRGALIRSAVDMLFVVKHQVTPWMRAGTWADIHPSAGWGWEHMWVLNGLSKNVAGPPAPLPPTTEHTFWIGRGSGLTPDEQKQVVAAGHVVAYGDTWLVDQRAAPAPIDAFSLNEREPNPFEWYVYGGVEPVRSIGPQSDPFLTWEWRVHLDQASDIQLTEPATLNEMRIAHNAAIERRDLAAAGALRSRILTALDTTRAAAFDQGIRMLGTRVTAGVQPRVEAWFEASGPAPSDALFDIRSVVIATNPLSLIPVDDTVRAMSYPPQISPKLWRPGFIYKLDAVLNHRIGRERYWGTWTSRAGVPPRRLDGSLATDLAVVP